jgi:hypothetical protein
MLCAEHGLHMYQLKLNQQDAGNNRQISCTTLHNNREAQQSPPEARRQFAGVHAVM